MPFVSNAQRKWMFANKPSMAKEWAAHTPKSKKLPEHVTKKAALKKEAVTRGIKELRALLTSGKYPEAAGMAQAYAQLGLKPRFVQQLGRGAEGLADLMAGKLPVGTQNPGLFVRKVYDPASIVSRGNLTSDVLRDKLLATKQMRALSPEAHQMVPDMYGYTVHRRTRPVKYPILSDNLRHTSYNEYVPGATAFPRQNTPVSKFETAIEQPMLARYNTTIHDVAHNRGNYVQDYKGNPKVLDFLPTHPDLESAPLYNFPRTKADIQESLPITSRRAEQSKMYTNPQLRKELFTKTRTSGTYT